MNRRLILITNSGSEDELKGVAIDKNNYLSYFKSSAGGAWQDKEITILDKPTKSELHRRILFSGIRDIEYFLIVFCGHGFAGLDSEGHKYTVLELSEREELSVPMLASWLRNTRAILIADCCRVVYTCQFKQPILEERDFSDVIDSLDSNKCRYLYNKAIETMVPYGFYAVYSTDYDEKAGDSDVYGGVYSYYLLDSARAAVKTLKNNGNMVAYMAEIHDIASPKVVAERNVKQHPWRGVGIDRIPFVIVA